MTSPAVDQQAITPIPNVSETPYAKREFWLVLAALTALYVVVVAIGNRRYVWFDELFTFDIARSASLRELWYRVLRFDCNPPTGYLLSRISMSIFGSSPFGLRFPSMVEFYVGSIAVLLYVRRKAGIAFGAVAVLMLWAVGPTLYYAVEARPYALLFSSFAFLLLSWDTAIQAKPRGWALFGISISTLALAGAHVFAPFTLFAFVVAEAVRFRRLRRPDYALWAALLVPMLGMLLYIPLIRLYGGIVFGTQASYNTIILFFEDTFGASIMAFVLLAALLVPLRKTAGQKSGRPAAEEIALFACLFLSPILLNLILMHRHGMFYNRYNVPSQAAILAALAIFIAYRVRLNHLAAYAAAAVLILAILKGQVWHPLLYPPPQRTGVLASVRPNLPVVAGEGQVFMEMNQRESQEFLARLYFLKDPQASLQYAHTNYFQDFEAPDVMQKAGFPFTANVASYSGFVNQHRQFLLLGNPTGWVFLKLRAGGASIAFVGDYSGALPYFDRTLYLVTMPSSGSQEE
jgi:Dolichyl-phosphate-mannose-protein mannosyltransferase